MHKRAVLAAALIFALSLTPCGQQAVTEAEPVPHAPELYTLLDTDPLKPLDREEMMAMLQKLPEMQACRAPRCIIEPVQAQAATSAENSASADPEFLVGPLPPNLKVRNRDGAEVAPMIKGKAGGYLKYAVRPFTGEIRVWDEEEGFFVNREWTFNRTDRLLDFRFSFEAMQTEGALIIRQGTYADPREAQLRAEQTAAYLEQEALPFFELSNEDGMWDEPMGRFARWRSGQWEVADSRWYGNNDPATRFWVVKYLGTEDPTEHWKSIKPLEDDMELLYMVVNLGCIH